MDPTEIVAAPNGNKLPATEPKPKGRGGRGSRNRRQDSRRSKINATSQSKIQTAEMSSLQLTGMSVVWRPSYGLYAGGVGVSCAGFAYFTSAMLRRMRNVAARPLALLLTEVNCFTYTKVSLYVLYVRLCCAQDDCLAALPGLTLRGILSATTKQLAASFCTSIPKALQYALSTFGYTKVDDQTVVPLLPPSDLALPSLAASLFPFLLHYVTLHAEDPVPEDERPAVVLLGSIIPRFALTANFRFTAASQAFWVDVTQAEWETFRSVNSAARAQKLCLEDFNLLAGTGQVAQIIRFDRLQDSFLPAQFYSVKVVEELEIVRSLAIRPGVDSADPPASLDRFALSYERAVLRGYDVPESAIEAILLSLVTRD